MRHSLIIVNSVRELRSLGKTYAEINNQLQLKIPKSTISTWCKEVRLPKGYREKVRKINQINFEKARIKAREINKSKREQFIRSLNEENFPLSKMIKKYEIGKIALSILCLGEAGKYSRGTPFCLGSSDPKIIVIFLTLLKQSFRFDEEKVRCTVQCRADQNVEELEDFWRRVTKIPKRLFYKAKIDPRTKGKPTLRKDYKGVLRVDYFDTKIQLELESLSTLIYNQLSKGPEV